MTKRLGLVSLVLSLLLVSPAAFAATLEPGESIDLLLTPGGICETDASVDPVDPLVKGVASCDAAANGMKALAGIDEGLGVAVEAEATATSSLIYGFTVGSDEATVDNTIDARVLYDIAWSGDRDPVSSEATVLMLVTLTDVTMVPGDEIFQETIHQAPKMGDTSGEDMGNAKGTIDAMLVRGNDYEVSVQLHVEAHLASSSITPTISSDYLQDDRGATVNGLEVVADRDIGELEEQVAENTEAIEELNERVDALTVVVALLAESLDDAIDSFENHTHTYLTGRGNGHNNTEAETGAPIPGEDDDEEPDEGPGEEPDEEPDGGDQSLDTLATPEPLRPNGRERSQNPWYYWGAVEGASSYDVELLNVTSGLSEGISGHSGPDKVKDLKDGDSYTWRVRSRNADGPGAWSSWRDFYVSGSFSRFGR